jgi:hypothetical protein
MKRHAPLTPPLRRATPVFVPMALLVLMALVLPSCGGETPPPPDESLDAGSAPAAPATLDPEREARVLALAEPAAGALAGGLVTRLAAALEEGGPVGAVDFCSLEALPLTREIEEGLEGLEVKRTTTRTRNPLNAPDSLEAAVLSWLEALEAEGSALPTHVVQADGEAVRFYRPLRTAALCLQCHGDPAGFSPELRAILAERYPADRAVGYAEGALRGVIRITVPAERLR